MQKNHRQHRDHSTGAQQQNNPWALLDQKLFFLYSNVNR
ncbi:hypothetical protein SynBIOSE41_01736 [Synechococcus sp. BIOS-E4-1]|nr:hypothetical protein SynBIOSE41_01736 [Synechococcus sp. BIOS-E4-1]